jgi:two-component sensor histidine kinase
MVTPTMPVNRDERALLRALTHRIHNDVLSSINLVSLAAVRSDNSEVKAALGNVVEFLERHAVVHRVLSIPDKGGLVDAADCIRRLAVAITRSLEPMGIRLTLVADTLPMESERSWRLALAVHELITNAARHACFDGRDGAIRIELSSSDAAVNCIVADNGSLPTRLKPARGLQMVSDLVECLDGQVEYDFGAQFSSFRLTFQLTTKEQRANRIVASRRTRAALQLKATMPQSRSQAPRAQSAHARDIPEAGAAAAAVFRGETENA